MSILVFYDKKKNKISNKKLIEADSSTLEKFGSFYAIDQFNEIPNKIVGGKTILEWLSINNTSFWWFIHPIIFPKYNEVILFSYRILSFIDEYNPTEIRLNGFYDKIKILKQICKLKNITLKVNSKNYVMFLIKDFFKNKIKKYAYKKFTSKKIKIRLNKYFTLKGEFKQPTSSYTIITGINRRIPSVTNFGNSTKEEFIIQPIMDLLKENNFTFQCFDMDYTLKGNHKSFEEKLSTQFEWIPVEILISKPKNSSVKSSIKLLQNSVNSMIKNDMNSLFVYEGISLWDYLKPLFKEIFYEPYLPTYIHLIDELEKFLSKNKPKVIIQVYETGPYEKVFEVVAKKLGIKTVGIQHGIIYDGNPDYMHKYIQSPRCPLGNPIPDLTLVFGEKYKKILIEKGSYPQEKVVVIGNPAFFNIDQIKKNFPKQRIIEKLCLPKNKIVFVPLTYRLFIDSTNYQDFELLDSLYKEFKNDDKITILIRPHPSDSDDFEKQFKILYPSKNFIVSKESLFEDIIVSDVVVTTISTVGIDSVPFEKHIIYANKANTENITFSSIQKDMVDHKVAIICSKYELIQKIKIIKKDELWKTDDSIKREKFLQDYFNFGEQVDLIKILYNN